MISTHQGITTNNLGTVDKTDTTKKHNERKPIFQFSGLFDINNKNDI